MSQLEADLSNSHQVVALFIDRFRQGRDAIADLTRRNTSLSKTYSELKVQAVVLEQGAAKSQADAERTREALDDQKKVNGTLKDEAAAFATERSSWRTKLAVSETQGKSVEMKLMKVKKELEDEKDGSTRLSSEVESLKNRLNSAQSKLRASATQAEGVKAELSRTVKELDAQK